MNVGITGAAGLLGWHLRCALIRNEEFNAIPAFRQTFLSDELLLRFAGDCDVIVHFAGMNRGDDREIYETNVELSAQLISAITRTGRCKHVLFSSSTHISKDTSYGRSKRKCSELLEGWSRKTKGSTFTNLVLPNVFGEGGRPFYNSVVSTFAHQIANHEVPEIKADAEIELLHSQRVADVVLESIRNKIVGQRRPSGTILSVSTLLNKLSRMYAFYMSHIVPNLETTVDLDLFNTLRSYLYPAYYPVRIPVYADNRGLLFEAIKTENAGQTFVSSTKPGIVRGNHFHRRKIERFLVISGVAEIKIRKLFSEEAKSFVVNGSEPVYIDIPTLHTHNIKNLDGHDLTTVFWAHEIFDATHPDTISESV